MVRPVLVTFPWGRENGCYSNMVDELEALWSKLTFTEEEGKDIALGSNSTKVAREIGKNCVVMKILTKRIIFLEVLRKNMKNAMETKQGTSNL